MRFATSLFLSLTTLLISGCGNSPNPDTLGSKAAARGILFGTSVTASQLASDRTYAQLVADHARIIVPMTELRWLNTEPQPGSFTFAPADSIYAFARKHHLLFRGHMLIWHGSTPDWAVTDPATARLSLQRHIAGVVGHYAGHVHSWDVVNEPLEPADGRPDGLRNSPWLQLLGAEYIDLAFRAAAAADPKAVLTINDYGLEGDPIRQQAMLALLTRLKQSGVPVGALGLQGHLGTNSWWNSEQFASFLNSVAALGLKIYVTELDVSDTTDPEPPAARDAHVAAIYTRFLTEVLQQPATPLIETWGLSDRYTWLSSWDPRHDGQAERPLLLDCNLAPKPAWNSFVTAFDNAPPR